MYKWFSIMLLCATTQVLGQQTRLIRLVDDYSGQTIDLDSKTHVHQRRCTVDMNQNLLSVKEFRRQLRIEVPDYLPYEGEIDRRSAHSDTLCIRMTPSEKLIRIGYEQYWKNPVVSEDTLLFSTLDAFSKYLKVRLNYLMPVIHPLENEFCCTTGIIRLQLNIEPIDSVFKLVSWKAMNNEAIVDSRALRLHLDQLISQMPPFSLPLAGAAYKIPITIFWR